VERWKGSLNQVHQAIYCVIPGKRMLDSGSSLLEKDVEMCEGAMNTGQNDLSVNPCNPFHPYEPWHANLIRIDGLD